MAVCCASCLAACTLQQRHAECRTEPYQRPSGLTDAVQQPDTVLHAPIVDGTMQALHATHSISPAITPIKA